MQRRLEGHGGREPGPDDNANVMQPPGSFPGVPKAKPTPKPPPKVAGVGDAIDLLESRRRSRAALPKPAGRRGDLDLDTIR